MKYFAPLVLAAAMFSAAGFAEKLGSNHQIGQSSDKQSGGESGPGQGQQGKHRGPPPEALAACEGKSSGAECSFQSPRGDTVSGTCFAPKSDLPLGCRPSHPPGQNGGGRGQGGGQGQGGQGQNSGGGGQDGPPPGDE